MNWNQWGQELHDRLDEKLQMLRHYFIISQEMKNALETHNVERIADSANMRGSTIESIKTLDKRITALAKEKKITEERFPQCVKDMIVPLVIKIENVLRSLAEIDRACLTLAIAEHEVRKNELLRIRNGVAVAKGYGARGKVIPRFLDIKK
jgi:hypothetical protein